MPTTRTAGPRRREGQGTLSGLLATISLHDARTRTSNSRVLVEDAGRPDICPSALVLIGGPRWRLSWSLAPHEP